MKIRIFVSFILLIATAFSIVSCKTDNETRVEFCELGIVLGEGFETYDSEGAFNVAYSDGKTIVGISRFSFVDCEEYGILTTFTPRKFAEVYLQRLGRTVDEGVKLHGDVPYFTYTNVDSDGQTYFYMPTFYRTPYAYFLITFITPKTREAVGRVEFLDYTSTVYILNEYL